METNKFNGTNYNDCLRNLRIVLDFENQGYVLDKPLPAALPEGSSPEERLTFEKWHEKTERYAATKAFFGTKMAEGSSVQNHGVKMLFLVEKLEDLKAGLNNDTYIDVILQSLSQSYDPFIVNYNMNRLEKSIHELINMLTLKEEEGQENGGQGHCKHQRCPCCPDGKRAKGRLGVLSSQRQMMCVCIAKKRGIGRGSVHNSSPTQVLERSKKLSKDEMILRLDDGKAIAAEAMGSLSLVIWHARLGHISKDRIRKLVDSKNLEIDNLDHLPTCEFCLKGKMTKKSFVGQSAIANGLLDLVHTDICGPLIIPARGGFSYFIIFTDDHSRYGYVYLIRYKSEAFERFKEYRLEVENQTNRKIKALRSDEAVST
ncbi:UNVERIFIED_CONTAM: hypothetical protein Slati_3104500 [Sesamum latifolium]|uniref:GAG-pre-integrase domain-containing protein n=1 Tax=Sesamum latifolium TaxID=2727402 RepID=A0AAW2UUK8_9LAMI